MRVYEAGFKWVGAQTYRMRSGRRPWADDSGRVRGGRAVRRARLRGTCSGAPPSTKRRRRRACRLRSFRRRDCGRSSN